MITDVHFISGLPRSGSTLLSAILRQNPRFHAGVTSPVAGLVTSLVAKMSGASEFAPFFDDPRRIKVLRGVFDSFYGDGPPVVFDTNRNWTAKADLAHTLYLQAKFICMVREIAWINDSIERLLRKNPLQVARVLDFQPGSSVYSRTEKLMNSETGMIGLAWSCLREMWFSDLQDRIIIIDYNRLVRDPAGTLRKLYAALSEAPYAHDFQNIVFDEPDYDANLGIPGLHKVRARVAAETRAPCIPPDIFAKYADAAFWERPDGLRGAMII